MRESEDAHPSVDLAVKCLHKHEDEPGSKSKVSFPSLHIQLLPDDSERKAQTPSPRATRSNIALTQSAQSLPNPLLDFLRNSPFSPLSSLALSAQ